MNRDSGRPVVVMVTGAAELAAAMAPITAQFPDIHADLVAAAARRMKSDGVMEFTVSGLAKDAGVRLGLAKDWLKTARDHRLMHVLGRRTDNGMIRYCAYRRLVNTESIAT
jgi:hypothetical protein